MIEPCRQWVKMNSLLTVYVCKFEGTHNGAKYFRKLHSKIMSPGSIPPQFSLFFLGIFNSKQMVPTYIFSFSLRISENYHVMIQSELMAMLTISCNEMQFQKNFMSHALRRMTRSKFEGSLGGRVGEFFKDHFRLQYTYYIRVAPKCHIS